MTWTAKTWINNSPPTLADVDLNSLRSELDSVTLTSNQVANTSDLQQTAKGISIYTAAGSFYGDSGVADAYVLAPLDSRLAPPLYFNGMKIRFVPLVTNTGASTANVDGIGLKSIKLIDTVTDPRAGDILAGEVFEGTFIASANVVVINRPVTASDALSGIVELADSTETRAQIETLKPITPSTVGDAISTALAWGQAETVGTPTLTNSYNTASVSSLGSAQFRFDFTVSAPTTDYSVCAMATDAPNSTYMTIIDTSDAAFFTVQGRDDSGGVNTPQLITFVVFA